MSRKRFIHRSRDLRSHGRSRWLSRIVSHSTSNDLASKREFRRDEVIQTTRPGPVGYWAYDTGYGATVAIDTKSH